MLEGNPTRQDAVRQLLRRFGRCLGSRARQSGGGAVRPKAGGL